MPNSSVVMPSTPAKEPSKMIRDYFAEMYVAGLLADAGWNIYFPRRDKGFDYIITHLSAGATLVRPVQVKGLYPTADKRDKTAYGYNGRLSQLHTDMALILVYFSPGTRTGTPCHIAYMPHSQIRARDRGGFRCVPCRLSNGAVTPRRDFGQYFDVSGLSAMSNPDWS